MKYEMIKEGNLYRIKALKDFGDVKKGDLGGLISKEENLAQGGSCWVYYNAKIFDNARIMDNVRIYDDVEIYGNVRIYDNVIISGDIEISGFSEIRSTIKSNNDFVVLGVFGEHYRHITFQDKNKVACGYFYDTIDNFEKAVKKKYGEDCGSYAKAIKVLRLLEVK